MRKLFRYAAGLAGVLFTSAAMALPISPPPPPDPPCWPPPCIPIDNGVVFLMIAGALLAGTVLIRTFKAQKSE